MRHVQYPASAVNSRTHLLPNGAHVRTHAKCTSRTLDPTSKTYGRPVSRGRARRNETTTTKQKHATPPNAHTPTQNNNACRTLPLSHIRTHATLREHPPRVVESKRGSLDEERDGHQQPCHSDNPGDLQAEVGVGEPSLGRPPSILRPAVGGRYGSRCRCPFHQVHVVGHTVTHLSREKYNQNIRWMETRFCAAGHNVCGRLPMSRKCNHHRECGLLCPCNCLDLQGCSWLRMGIVVWFTLCPARGRAGLTHVHEQNEVGWKECDDVHHGLERHEVGQLVDGEVEVHQEAEQEKSAWVFRRRTPPAKGKKPQRQKGKTKATVDHEKGARTELR